MLRLHTEASRQLLRALLRHLAALRDREAPLVERAIIVRSIEKLHKELT